MGVLARADALPAGVGPTIDDGLSQPTGDPAALPGRAEKMERQSCEAVKGLMALIDTGRL